MRDFFNRPTGGTANQLRLLMCLFAGVQLRYTTKILIQ